LRLADAAVIAANCCTTNFIEELFVADKRVARKQPGRIRRFWKETTGELRKVSWPTRREALALTRIVILVILTVGTLLFGFDYLFAQLFALIF